MIAGIRAHKVYKYWYTMHLLEVFIKSERLSVIVSLKRRQNGEKRMVPVKHAYWIHKTREDKNSMSGFVYLPQCSCSNCGYESNFEKAVCPHCQVLMDAKAPAGN